MLFHFGFQCVILYRKNDIDFLIGVVNAGFKKKQKTKNQIPEISLTQLKYE